MAEKPIAHQTVLAVFSPGEDRTSLATIFAGSHWKIRFVSAYQEMLTALRASPAVVISDSSGCEGHCWKDLLLEVQKMEYPPPVIVADRLADERLWAEALNLGVQDLLAKPFDAREVLHAVRAACCRWEGEHYSRKPARSAAESGSVSERNVRAAF